MTFTAPELDPSNRFCGRGETVARQEQKRREALWDLFQSEIVFLLDHLMVLRHVRLYSVLAGFSNRSSFTTFFLKVYMEPLKKVQVEGYIMFAEPEVLFGNLDELCCVSFVYLRRYCSRSLRRHKTDEMSRGWGIILYCNPKRYAEATSVHIDILSLIMAFILGNGHTSAPQNKSLSQFYDEEACRTLIG